MNTHIMNTPILVEFADRNLPVPQHFNQSLMLKASRKLNMFTLHAAFTILTQCHDILRAKWNGSSLYVRNATEKNLFHLEEHNLQNSTDIEHDILPLCNKLQSSIDILNGPMMRIAVFHLKAYDIMLIVIHHLVVDGVSWHIILEDLNKIYRTLLQGKLAVRLPKRTCSFAQYAEELNKYSTDSRLMAELTYWQNVAAKIHNYDLHTSHNYTTQFFQLDQHTTEKLIYQGNRHYNADINAILLTALSRAWKKVTGQDVLPLEMEGHGREQFSDQQLNLERIVGWFTTVFPVALPYINADISEHVHTIDIMLKDIPNHGLGYGILYKIRRIADIQCQPLVTFNYLGSFDEMHNDDFFQIEKQLPHGENISPKNTATTPININCIISGNTLAASIVFDSGVFDEEKGKAFNTELVEQLKQIASF